VSIAYFAMFFLWFTMILIAPLRLQLVQGATATEAGVLLTPGIISAPITATVVGQLLSRIGRARPFARVGGLLQLIGLAMMLVVPNEHGDWWVLVSFAVVGMGTGFTGPSLMSAFQNAMPPSRMGAGVGVVSLFRQFGSSLGTTVVGALVGATVVVAASPDMAAAIHQAVLIQLAAGLLVLVPTLLMADVPLGTGRPSLGSGPARKGQTWSQLPADH
jgi:MFS family permease